MTLYDKNKIILVIFQTAAEIVISNISDFLPIPKWVDFLIKFSIDFPKALQSKLGNQVSKKEIVETISSLNKKEVKEIIDAVLESDDNKQRVENLTPQQVDAVRKKLSSLPNEIENILTNIETQTRIQISQREQYVKSREKEEYLALKEELNTLIRHENIEEAHKTSVRLLKLNPFDFEVSALEGKLYRIKQLRHPSEYMKGFKKRFIFSLALLFGSSFFCLILGYENPQILSLTATVFLPSLILLVVIFAITQLWGYFPYIIRRVLIWVMLIPLFIIVGGFLLLILFSK